MIVQRCMFVAVLTCAAAVAFSQTPREADAESTRAKLAFIRATGDRPPSEDRRPVHTSLTDHEINQYLLADGPAFLPEGLTDPQFEIREHGRITMRGVIDLDAVRLSRQRDWLDPMAYLSGLLEFIATSIVTTADGQGVVRFESAMLGGVAVPRNVVRELLRYYTTTPETPSGLDLDAPIELPANIQSILFEPGRATVVQ